MRIRLRSARIAGVAAALAATMSWAAPAPAQLAPGTPVRIDLTRQSAFVEPAGTFELNVSISGPVPEDATVWVERYEGISDEANPRDQLDVWIAGKPARAARRSEAGPFRVGEILNGPGDAGDIAVRLNAHRDVPGGLRVDDAGVFPIVVRLDAPDRRGIAEARTFLIRLPNRDNVGSSPPLRVAPVVGLRSPASLKPDGSRSMEPAQLARLQRTLKLLTDHPAAPLTVDPLPETLTALSDLGNGRSGPEVIRTAIGSRQILASTVVDLDVDQWVAANLRDQVERQRKIAISALDDPGFTRRVGQVDAATWVARRPLGASARSALQGIDAPAVTRLVVPAGHLGPVQGRGVPVDADRSTFDILHDGGAARGVVADERLASRLTATGNAVLDAQATLADMAILACGSKTGGTTHCNTMPREARAVGLIVPDDQRALDALDIVLDGIGAGEPFVRSTDLAGLFEVQPVTAPGTRNPIVRAYDVGEQPASEVLTDFAARLGQLSRRVNGFRSMLVEPAPAADEPSRTDDRELDAGPADELLRRLDVAGSIGTPDGPTRYLDEVAATIDDRLGAVDTPPRQTVTMTSTELDVPIPIENGLDQAVTVDIHLSSARPIFEGMRATTLRRRVPARSTSNIAVRVGTTQSGLFPLEVRVTTPDGTVEVLATTIEIRSTVVSSVGLVLTIAAGLFLAVWWARHFRDARRARKLVDVDDVAEAVAMASGETPAVRDPATLTGPRQGPR